MNVGYWFEAFCDPREDSACRKYTIPEIVDLLKKVYLFPTDTSSKNFYVQLVRVVISNMLEKFEDLSSLVYGTFMAEEMRCPSLLIRLMAYMVQIVLRNLRGSKTLIRLLEF